MRRARVPLSDDEAVPERPRHGPGTSKSYQRDGKYFRRCRFCNAESSPAKSADSVNHWASLHEKKCSQRR